MNVVIAPFASEGLQARVLLCTGLRLASSAGANLRAMRILLVVAKRVTQADGRAWRVYVLHTERSLFHVQVGQPWEERLDLLDEIAENLLWPALAQRTTNTFA